ncbi:Alcohol oxidase [Psilocybe cubensis]|uniref:pyranose dehydrogenase (acceptor) n=2 Tax=Psilocybe cubensis TaxID=181762 RepID=A0A8H7XYC9_PSICU|nr:Alcohol oxidase [Psilocybe cubensis]KAH9481243.1 Alcohol oxidase [Psilocybe cubensis]
MTTEADYDIIFAGGGASACITAGRLAAADPSLKILVVEAGPHTREKRDVIQPARYANALARVATGESEMFAVHVGKPTDSLLGRAPIVLAPSAVGGGSSVNFMVYTRGAASDYDDWEIEYGNAGWGSKHLIPLLKKAETYQPETKNDTHGTSGPLKISHVPPGLINIASNSLEVAAAYDKKRPQITEDVNTFYECNKYGYAERYINGLTGRRSDTAHHYIYNQENNLNLTVLDRHRVIRVIFEGNRAVGIEYLDDLAGRKGGDVARVIARASRLVVVAAGTLGSPTILERSGIGAKSILDKAGIKTLVDLPGVGENYQDHNLMFLQSKATPDTDSMDGIFRGDEEVIAKHEKQWLENGQGLMAHNGLFWGIKIRPVEEELRSMSPDFDQRWKTYYASPEHQDKPIALLGFMAAYGGATPDVPIAKYFSFVYFSAYPASVGSIHVTSGTDPYAPSDFHPGFLDDPSDLSVLRFCYKKARELSRRIKYYAGDVVAIHPNFKETSEAKPKASSAPASLTDADIVYSKEDDEAIDEYHRKRAESGWHSIGTCAMKPRETGGVVDARLNVYGVQGLKVADCSIAPANVGANMYNTAIAIGEKAAVIIAQDLGIGGVSEE